MSISLSHLDQPDEANKANEANVANVANVAVLALPDPSAAAIPTAAPSPVTHLEQTGPRLHTVEPGFLFSPDATVIQVNPWRDPFIEQIGHDPRGDYVERFWLAVLGPSTTWFVRSLSWGFSASPEGFALDLPATARALGISERMGRNSPFVRAITRACQFDLAAVDGVHPSGRTILRARTTLPWLSRRLAATLPPTLRAEHQLWIDASAVDAAERRRVAMTAS